MTTSMNRIIPNRAPGLTPTREAFEQTFGAYEPPAWMGESLCSQTDPSLFFSDKIGSSPSKMALAVCEACPVRDVCLEDALVYESGEIDTGQSLAEAHGIRGGLTARQRKPLIQARMNPSAKQDRRRAAAVAMYAAGASLTAVVTKHRIDPPGLRAWLIADGVWRYPEKGKS